MKNENKKHTPGPWRYTQSPKGGYNIRYGDNIAIARVLNLWSPQANARLIAGAPELLEALESIEADINKHLAPGSQSTFMTLVNVMSAQRKIIRTAIAKAKGI